LTFNNPVSVDSTTSVEVTSLAVSSGATRDVVFNASVYPESPGAAAGRYLISCARESSAGDPTMTTFTSGMIAIR
jgi:hypothetical protein